MSINHLTDPPLFLGVGTADGAATNCPLFAAFHVTSALLERLRLLTSLCKQHDLESVQTRDIPHPIYWDIPPGSAIDGANLDWTWHAISTRLYVELRTRQSGEDGAVHEVSFRTQSIELSDLENTRAQGPFPEFIGFEDPATPVMAVLDVTDRFLEQLRDLTAHFEQCGIESFQTRELSRFIQWEPLGGNSLMGLSHMETVWHISGAGHHAELTASRQGAVGSSDGRKVIYKTRTVSLAELSDSRKQGVYREVLPVVEPTPVYGDSFCLAVLGRMISMALWTMETTGDPVTFPRLDNKGERRNHPQIRNEIRAPQVLQPWRGSPHATM